MSGQIWVNDRDIEADLGVTAYLSDLEGWGAGTEYGREILFAPDSMEGTAGPTVVTQAREVRLQMRVNAGTVAGRETTMALASDLFRGLLEIRTVDSPNRVLEGFVVAESSAVLATESAFAIADMYLTYQIRCANPTKRDRVVRSVACAATTTRYPIPLGTMPSQGELYLMNATNPVVTYRNSSGDVVRTMTFTVTIASDEYYKVDLLTKRITKYDTGVATAANSILTSTSPSGKWIEPDPEDGSYELSAWPTIETSSGQVLYVYPRRWKI